MGGFQFVSITVYQILSIMLWYPFSAREIVETGLFWAKHTN